MTAAAERGSYSEQVVPGFAYAYAGDLIASERSAFQQIDIYSNDAFGRVLLLDGLVQTTERDEFVYHEMLVHVPLIAHPEPRTVLVIGGGDGGTLRRVLEHPSVERAVMAEIDQRVTELCLQHMPSIAGAAFEDLRSDVRFIDGIDYVKQTTDRFDVVLVDSSDPVGPGEGLFTPAFYEAARGILNEGGILAVQSGSPYFQQDELHRTAQRVTQAFGAATTYLAVVPTYPGSLWTFTIGGAHDPLGREDAASRAQARDLRTRYWSPALQSGAFALPQIVLDVTGPDGPPHTWGLSPEETSRATR